MQLLLAHLNNIVLIANYVYCDQNLMRLPSGHERAHENQQCV